jgi:UrcA family protein
MTRRTEGPFFLISLAAMAIISPFIATSPAVAASAGMAVAAMAPASAADVPTVAVRYADLDLRHEAGVKVLYRRLYNAAVEVCGQRERTGSRIVRVAWKSCVAATVAAAVAMVDRPELTAYHQQRTDATAPLQASLLAPRN